MTRTCTVRRPPTMSLQRVIQLLFVCWWAQAAQSCIHDFLDHKFVIGTQTYHDSHPFIWNERKRRPRDGNEPELVTTTTASNTRNLTATSFQPIPMTPFYYNSSLSNLPDATRDIVFKAVDKAIQRIRRALQVVPVSGNLFAERVCTATLTTTPPVCHSIAENHLCLEMPIPDGHFASLRYCDKCTSNGCTADACIVSPAGTGVPNTDFLNYVRVEDTDDCRSSSTLAYASTCQQDQYDRPTFGVTNFSPKKLSTSDSAFEHQVSTALHELLHTLDFSSRFFPLMRYEDVTPRTPRDEQGNPPIFNAGTCPNGKQIDYYVEPANTTINYSTERDHVVAKLVTPRVRAFVQDHAICSTLVSTELESQDGGCIGSHCEERLFEPEYMTPVDSYHARLLRRFRLVSSQRLDLRGHALWSKERMLLRNGEVCRSGDAESDSCGPFYGMTPSTECQRCSVDATSRAVCFFEH